MPAMFLISLMFVALGVMIRFCKWYWLISGYNTMTKERKRQVDIEGLGRFMGNSLFLMAGVIAVGGVTAYYDVPGASFAMPLAIAGFVVYMLIKAQRFDAGAVNPDGTMKTLTKIILGSVFALFAVIAIFILINTIAPEVVVNAESVQIKGMYGIEVEYNNISEITIKESLPTILRRTNGFSAGGTLKGHFVLQDIGRARLYVNTRVPPFIYIHAVDGLIIVNQGDRQSTEELYHAIVNAFN